MSLAIFSGCKKAQKSEKPPASEIHAISREFMDAIKAAAPPNVSSVMRAEASDQKPDSYDSISVNVLADPDSSSRSVIARLLQALAGVAARHHLSRDLLESREGLLYAFRRAGIILLMLHFHEQIDVDSSKFGSSGGRLAVILDDLGNDPAAAEAIFDLSCPITLSVLPNHPHSAEIAQEAQRRGYEVMLHLPMQSIGDKKRESEELRHGMSAAQVASLMDELLRSVPEARGVNNHQGSQSTADLQLMDELMPVLRQRHLFYVDSRTTPATVAFDTAQRIGVPSGFRNTPFLDDVAEVAPIRRQLQLALRKAHEKGEVIAIGHPHPATLQALKEVLPEARVQGVRLVYASELVH